MSSHSIVFGVYTLWSSEHAAILLFLFQLCIHVFFPLLSLPVQQVAKENQELMARALEEVSCLPLGSLTSTSSTEVQLISFSLSLPGRGRDASQVGADPGDQSHGERTPHQDPLRGPHRDGGTRAASRDVCL